MHPCLMYCSYDIPRSRVFCNEVLVLLLSAFFVTIFATVFLISKKGHINWENDLVRRIIYILDIYRASKSRYCMVAMGERYKSSYWERECTFKFLCRLLLPRWTSSLSSKLIPCNSKPFLSNCHSPWWHRLRSYISKFKMATFRYVLAFGPMILT
jgi:hypothetical protein